jgi:hypothetical protein
MTDKAPAAARRVGFVAGGLVLAIVAATYVFSLGRGRWPPSHPWSGITLVILATAQFGVPARLPSWWRVVWAAATLAPALMWCWSAYLLR